MRRALGGALLGVLIAARPAGAGQGLDVHGLRPPADPFGYVAVPGSGALAAGRGHVAVYVSDAHEPLEGEGPATAAVQRLATLEVVAGLGLVNLGRGRAIQLGVGLPLVLDVDGHGPDGGRLQAGLLGDVRAELKAGFGDAAERGLGWMARTVLEWPTGRQRAFVSDGGLGWQLELGLEAVRSSLRGALVLGCEWLPGEARTPGVRAGDRLRLGAALGWAALRDLAGLEHLEAVFELRHAVRLGDPYARSSEVALELEGAIRYRDRRWLVLAGGGGRLGRGAGAAQSRWCVAAGWNF
ncbi:MAG: hypothetical protein KatS3mg102_1576 [Planctomycetota bacterium]|nr:MAG: hypothetical protein KatS3mg102_1576 [Planctomycetota bacterium]